MGKGKALQPLTAAALEAIALRYLERFQTTRARLARHLGHKLRAAGWEGDEPPDIAALVERLAVRGYLDEEAFAAARARAMARRGLGGRRIAAQLMADGIDRGRAAVHAEGTCSDAAAQARAFARRRRFGPYAGAALDQASWNRQFAAMLRAGHAAEVARRVLSAAPGEAGDGRPEEAGNNPAD